MTEPSSSLVSSEFHPESKETKTECLIGLSNERNDDDDASKTTKRRNLGRNARRRRKKVLAIEAAAVEAASSPSGDTAKKEIGTILPQDRGYVWPAVNDLCTLSVEDKHALIGQLGYLPGNALSVVARWKDIFPSSADDSNDLLVIQLYPLVMRDESDGTKSRRKRTKRQKQQQDKDTDSTDTTSLMEPFPTLYWVTHPRARALISKLELTSQFQQQLETDTGALATMKVAHGQYGQERYNLITDKDWNFIQQRNWQSAFSIERGVAGIKNPAGIKCLHAHAAHFWSGCQSNVVGKWVTEELHSMLK